MDPHGIAARKHNSSRNSNNGSIHSKRRRVVGIESRRRGGRRSAFSGGASVMSGRSVSSSRASNNASYSLGIARGSNSNSIRKQHAAGGGFATAQQPPPPKSHVLCAIGENLARETCVVSLDLSAPFLLTVTKQSNGQSYSETIACMTVLCPHEVLMNEGRYHSPLARKILGHFDLQRQQKQHQREKEKPQSRGAATISTGRNEPASDPSDDEETVVKFISRSCFDQTKGADLLRKLARQDTYDSTLVDEYILLSSSHAILHYAQVTLGAVAFAKHTLDVKVHTGGHNHNKMEIDRSTLLQLELLTNNGCKSSSSSSLSNRKHSLIATMDCTKTGVGHRLLRTTLMAPPCRLDTITARLDLVDTFLKDEDMFYATLKQLQNLSSLDNMLTNIVVIPSKMHLQRQQQRQILRIASTHDRSSSNSSQAASVSLSMAGEPPSGSSSASAMAASGKTAAANARIASKGISALVCIKSTLASVPVLAAILKRHLERIDEKTNKSQQKQEQDIAAGNKEDQEAREEATIATAKTSLLVGLGVGKGSSSSCSNSASSAVTQNQLLRAIIFALSQPDLEVIRETINGTFTESTAFTKNANAMKHQECFALKSSDDNGLMGILRKAFLSNVDDIYRKADEYAEVHGISHVAVKYSTARGYYLSLPLEMASNLPTEFIQPSKSGRFIFCTTEEVQSLNTRSQDNIQDLLLLTHERIQEVLDVARSKYDALARLSDAIALLDLCHSFADKVTLSKLPWTRPSLTDGGVAASIDTETEDSTGNGNGDNNNNNNSTSAASIPLPEETYAIAICNGRYGIEIGDVGFPSESGPGKWISNDTYASLSQNLTIISGINGSGKSTYLKQIAIIVLLAHCGSYVPAEEALIPLTNRLCARMMTADDQENNISSFMLEMKETAFICNNATSRSLILLDELGRATSNEDGVAIAWAVAESLLAKGAMTYFVTHYPQLCQMSRTYPSVQNQHLKASISGDGDGRIRYSHKIESGPCDATSNYGVDMAVSCGWPSDVVKEARTIENTLKDKLTEAPLCGEECDIETEIRHKKVLKATAQKVVDCVSSECEPTMDALRSALQALKVSLLDEIPKSAIAILLDINDEDKETTM